MGKKYKKHAAKKEPTLVDAYLIHARSLQKNDQYIDANIYLVSLLEHRNIRENEEFRSILTEALISTAQQKNIDNMLSHLGPDMLRHLVLQSRKLAISPSLESEIFFKSCEKLWACKDYPNLKFIYEYSDGYAEALSKVKWLMCDGTEPNQEFLVSSVVTGMVNFIINRPYEETLTQKEQLLALATELQSQLAAKNNLSAIITRELFADQEIAAALSFLESRDSARANIFVAPLVYLNLPDDDLRKKSFREWLGQHKNCAEFYDYGSPQSYLLACGCYRKASQLGIDSELGSEHAVPARNIAFLALAEALAKPEFPLLLQKYKTLSSSQKEEFAQHAGDFIKKYRGKKSLNLLPLAPNLIEVGFATDSDDLKDIFYWLFLNFAKNGYEDLMSKKISTYYEFESDTYETILGSLKEAVKYCRNDSYKDKLLQFIKTLTHCDEFSRQWLDDTGTDIKKKKKSGKMPESRINERLISISELVLMYPWHDIWRSKLALEAVVEHTRDLIHKHPRISSKDKETFVTSIEMALDCLCPGCTSSMLRSLALLCDKYSIKPLLKIDLASIMVTVSPEVSQPSLVANNEDPFVVLELPLNCTSKDIPLAVMAKMRKYPYDLKKLRLAQSLLLNNRQRVVFEYFCHSDPISTHEAVF